MSDFDHCKENIQPQRRGHSSAELMNLNRLNDPEFRAKVKAEEMEWELLRQIRMISLTYDLLAILLQNTKSSTLAVF